MIFAGECNGEIFCLPYAESVEINQELYVPADDMTVVFPYGGNIPDIHKIYMLDDNCVNIQKAVRECDVLFKGVVDEQILSADVNGAVIKIYARSMASVLLDNECPPLMYVNPSADVIYSKHIEPFGVGFEFDNVNCRSGVLSVAKGSSHYRVTEKFCAEFLGTVPKVDSRGICRFDMFADVGDILFDNKYGVEFESVNVCKNRYSRVSRVFVSGDNGYDMTVNDKEAQSFGIVRERYLNLANSETGTLSDADNIIKNGKMQSLSVTLMCGGCFINKLGYNAEVNVEGCVGERFVVAQIRYTVNNGVEKSRIRCVLKGD